MNEVHSPVGDGGRNFQPNSWSDSNARDETQVSLTRNAFAFPACPFTSHGLSSSNAQRAPFRPPTSTPRLQPSHRHLSPPGRKSLSQRSPCGCLRPGLLPPRVTGERDRPRSDALTMEPRVLSTANNQGSFLAHSRTSTLCPYLQESTPQPPGPGCDEGQGLRNL